MTAIWKKHRGLRIVVAIVVVLMAALLQSLEPKVWMSIVLSGATLAALYFLVASGLSLIFGLMDVLNFAHGVLFVLGAYVGLSTFLNPRLLFNTLPFFFVVVASVALAQRFGRAFWHRISTRRGRQVATAGLLLLAAGLVFVAMRGFPIRALNAFNITAVGGAVTTAEAQEPMAIMLRRVTLMLLAGLPMGLLLAPKEAKDELPLPPLWQTLADLIEAVWGEEANPPMPPPSLFSGGCRSDSLLAWFSEHCQSIDVMGRAFPTYRLFIIAVGILVFVAVGLLLRRTRIGMIIRAGVQDSDMVQALGINVRRVFTIVFALGSALAAMGGVIAAPYLGVFPAMGGIFQLQAFIAVVIGGMGSYIGAAVGTIILGMARAFGDHFVAAGISVPFLDTVIKGSPAIARASTVLIMAIVLLVKPAGIFGKKE